MKEGLRRAAGKLTAPFVITLVVLFGFYLGGDSFQGFGLAAMDSTRRVLKYVLGVAAFLSLAVLVQRIVQYVIFDGIVASATGSPVPKLLSQISGLVIFGIAVSACAGIVFEQDLTVLWAASGVAGLVLGMALRELLQDVFAGIALNIDRAIRIGEYIQIHRSGDSKISGQVLEISWRTTRVRDFMGDLVIFPNSKFSAFTITNFSQPEANSFRFVTLTLDARVPLARATRILQAAALEAMTGLAGPDTPVPWVEVKAIRLEGVEYAIFYKAEWRHLGNASPMILQTVLTHLAFAGLETATVLTDGPSAADGAFGQAGGAGPDTAGLAALLRATALFRGLGDAPLRLLASHAAMRELPAGQVAIQAGEAGTSLYLVLEGLLSADAGRRSVRDPLPATLRPGDLFDPAILRGEAHGSTVRCRTAVLLCEFGADALQSLFAAGTGTMERVARNLVAGSSNRSTEDEERVADTLRQMRHLFPAPVGRQGPGIGTGIGPVANTG